MTDRETGDKVSRAKELYRMICAGKMTDGADVRTVLSELEEIVGKDFGNTQQFHYYVAEYIKRKDRVGETMGRRLLRMRRKSKLTQIDLASLLGVDRKTIIRWETDKQTPSEASVLWMNTINEPSGENGTFREKQDE
jgi:DNA-binding XRE family transcriptional regulator